MDAGKCDGCPLQGTITPVPSVYRKNARFLVVTDTPTDAAARRGALLSASPLAALAEGLQAAGFDRADFAFAAQIRCAFDADTYPTEDKKVIARKCREHLLDDIAHVRPEVLLPLGAAATSQVNGRPVKITKVRGVASYNEEHECMVLPLLSPGQVVMYPQNLGIFRSDCVSLKRLVDSDYDVKAASESMLGDYRLVDDLQFLIDRNPQLVAFDLETTSLEFFHEGTHSVRDYDPAIHGKDFDPHAAILTMQFSTKAGEGFLLPWDHPEAPLTGRRKKKIKEQLVKLLCRPGVRVVGQKLKFDTTYLYAKTGIRIKVGGDSLMLSALVDENLPSKSLDALVKIYVPKLAGYADHFNATVDKGRMWEQPLSRLVNYGCGDTDAALQVYRTLMRKVMDDGMLLANYKYVSLPGINAFTSMELRGVPVDYDALLAFEQVMAESVAEQEAELLAQVPDSIKRIHVGAGSKKGISGCTFTRPEFTRDVLFRHKDGFRLKPKVFTSTTAKLEKHLRVPSTSSKDHLPYFFDDCPFTQQLASYIKDERLLNTSVRGFKNKYIFNDLVRSEYSLWTAVTGRTSSERPNGQNYPTRGKTATAYRRIFRAPPGYYVLEADLSQAELRIAADMSRDPVMCRIYREAGDIHTATALLILGVTAEEFALLPKEERKAFRSKAKAANFGFLYGMWWKKFIGYAKTQYGVDFEDSAAEQLRANFFVKYRGLGPWHERMKAFAREHGYVRSYSGRIRHLPNIYSEEDWVRQEAERQAVNSPVQNFGSDLGVMTLGRLNEEVDDRFLAPIAFVHDAIYALVPEQYLEWGAKTLKWYMESNPIKEWFGIDMVVPIVADVSFGLNFGDTYEMEGLTLDDPYDFGKFWDAEERKGIIVPAQRTPPNDGMLTESIYTGY